MSIIEFNSIDLAENKGTDARREEPYASLFDKTLIVSHPTCVELPNDRVFRLPAASSLASSIKKVKGKYLIPDVIRDLCWNGVDPGPIARTQVSSGPVVLPGRYWIEWNDREPGFDGSNSPMQYGILVECHDGRRGKIHSFHAPYRFGAQLSGLSVLFDFDSLIAFECDGFATFPIDNDGILPASVMPHLLICVDEQWRKYFSALMGHKDSLTKHINSVARGVLPDFLFLMAFSKMVERSPPALWKESPHWKS